MSTMTIISAVPITTVITACIWPVSMLKRVALLRLGFQVRYE